MAKSGGRTMKEDNVREIWIGENRFYLGEDNILYVFNVGNVDDKCIIEIRKAMHKLISLSVGKVNVLIDINKAEKPSTKARRGFVEILENEKVGNVAIFGAHPVARVMASFVMGITRKKNLCFFKSKEEALTWLK